MKINVVSCLFGLALSAGMISCTKLNAEQEAKERASKFLKGTELLRAEREAKKSYGMTAADAPTVSYWDSLLIDAKVRKAELDGQKYATDSANGVRIRRPDFRIKLDTATVTNKLDKDLEKEFSEYVSAEELLKSRENAPQASIFNGYYGSNPNVMHYWNLIVQKGLEKQAFERGVQTAKAEMNK